MPVVAAGQARPVIEALLDHGPFPLICKDKRVQVNLEAVLHRGVVNFSAEPAAADQVVTVQTAGIGHRRYLVRGPPRLLPPPPADMYAQLF